MAARQAQCRGPARATQPRARPGRFREETEKHTVADLTSRYFLGLKDQLGWIAGALVLLVLGVITLFRALPPGFARRAYLAVTVALALGGCAWALHLGWV